MILRRLILYFGIALLIMSCYQYNKPEKPKNLISQAKMIDVLIDIKIISSANTFNKKVNDNQDISLNKYILKKHNIDSLQFALSNDYYSHNIKVYSEIYIKVQDSLEKLKILYKKMELKEANESKALKKKDSIFNKLLKGKDSITIIKIKDSLKTLTKKDSLSNSLLEMKLEEKRLILPVSDIEYPSQ